ncbi:hypothetical protein HID58_026799 [Brassica napus]|uniref:Uncharacterized protein n=1 Tax=Brassica napus TaxID=3708 RepID=A0ABQ8CPY6_BRANA|nr:hypothetical protein HID58_026799 [Brassica napus]
MAFLLPNLSPSFLLQTGKSLKEKPISTHSLSISSSSSSSNSYEFEEGSLSLLSLPVQAPPAPGAQVKTMPSEQDKHQQHGKDEFYINLGLAIRTLREDLPLLFSKDLNYDIYSPNPTFMFGSSYSSSWIEFYQAVQRTLDKQQDQIVMQDRFAYVDVVDLGKQTCVTHELVQLCLSNMTDILYGEVATAMRSPGFAVDPYET